MESALLRPALPSLTWFTGILVPGKVEDAAMELTVPLLNKDVLNVSSLAESVSLGV